MLQVERAAGRGGIHPGEPDENQTGYRERASQDWPLEGKEINQSNNTLRWTINQNKPTSQTRIKKIVIQNVTRIKKNQIIIKIQDKRKSKPRSTDPCWKVIMTLTNQTTANKQINKHTLRWLNQNKPTSQTWIEKIFIQIVTLLKNYEDYCYVFEIFWT